MTPKVVKLSNGVEIPIVGLGTYAQDDRIKQSIRGALEIGYRHFDTADFYRVITLFNKFFLPKF